MCLKGIPAGPACVALHAAGQVGGKAQAVVGVGKGQEAGGITLQIPPEAKAEHAVYNAAGSCQS